MGGDARLPDSGRRGCVGLRAAAGRRVPGFSVGSAAVGVAGRPGGVFQSAGRVLGRRLRVGGVLERVRVGVVGGWVRGVGTERVGARLPEFRSVGCDGCFRVPGVGSARWLARPVGPAGFSKVRAGSWVGGCDG